MTTTYDTAIRVTAFEFMLNAFPTNELCFLADQTMEGSGGDASDEVLDALRAKNFNVKPASSAWGDPENNGRLRDGETGQFGIRYTLHSLSDTVDGLVHAEGSYYIAPVGAGGMQMDLRLHVDQWLVVSSRDTWIA